MPGQVLECKSHVEVFEVIAVWTGRDSRVIRNQPCVLSSPTKPHSYPISFTLKM